MVAPVRILIRKSFVGYPPTSNCFYSCRNILPPSQWDSHSLLCYIQFVFNLSVFMVHPHTFFFHLLFRSFFSSLKSNYIRCCSCFMCCPVSFPLFLQSCSLSALFSLSSPLAFTVHTLQCTPPYQLSPSLSLSTVFTELLPVNCFVVISLSSPLVFTVQCTPPYLSPSLRSLFIVLQYHDYSI